ncbi:PI-PLC X domain-containing protein 1 isoform X4 [Ovis aries]|uniref:PI-PLC X domain-containing protein 1 isoform X4 n=1 Tax=Ovis aries TaxID=9940 RepID=UPI0029525E6E|nr:PI-PLC X domain-containing protein 1 isoform X4 [Ovis aries]
MQGAGRGMSRRRSPHLGEWVFPASSQAFEETPEAPAGQRAQRAAGSSRWTPRSESAVRTRRPPGRRADRLPRSPGSASDGRASELGRLLPRPALRLQGERGLDVGAELSTLGRATAPALHPRESRHDDLLPEQEVAHLQPGAEAAAASAQSAAVRHPARGAQVVHHTENKVPFLLLSYVTASLVAQLVLSVTEQLDAGVRYLDLRIAHMEEGSERNLHFVHMVYTTALVEDTLTEISEWLEGHPREVVILACRNFEGMTEGLHEYLVGCIKNIFGDMLCPRGEVPTLRQLWSRGQQVILSYEDEAAVSRHVELWPGIPYWWGNKVKPQDLVHYLERMKSCGRPGGLFVAGINLTENLEFILVHPAWSLQKLTLSGLPYLCAWVRAQCPGSAAGCTNIIAGDFIGASGFVSDVIGLNRKLLRG